jgi:adenylate kinase family enzyme
MPLPAMRERIHIFGASGSGTSTLGRKIAARFDLKFLEADDFYWVPSDPPYQSARDRVARQQLLLDALSGQTRWVLAGSICGWGDVAIDLFELAVFVETPTAIRLERLRAREQSRFGERLLASGDMHSNHTAFMAWAASYDDGSIDIRSRKMHEEWLHHLKCPVVRIDGSRPIDNNIEALSGTIAGSAGQEG